MIACGSCGKEIAEDFRLCPYCGTPVAVAPRREQRKRVTILFCDITGSTALGESTDPEALRSLLARYFERMKGIIQSHGGTVEKFIGDAVMAVFGVPRLHEDDALRACRAALEMRAALPELGIQCRIGVNSGEVVAGTQERLATGDAVNVAARLEQAAPPGEILIGAETLRLVRDTVEVAAIEPLSLKGKREPVPAFRLLTVNELAARPASAVPMVGRGRELDRLQDAFAQAVEDRSCQLFTILGSAGVGKSRLAAEFLQGLDGTRVLRARCLSYGEGITYWPVVEVIKQIERSPADPYADATVQSLLGEKAAATTADEIAWAFRLLLEQEAQSGPLVVVFDDIHWGEETFLDLIEHVAALSQDASILLLCMARPELLEKRPAWGGGKWNATTLLLEPLDTAETDELLDALGGVSDEMRERIRQAAEGNPLFVEEMLALIRESGGEAIAVPPTIQALLAARLDQLAPDERTVLEYGAVEGRVFHRSAVQTLANESTSLQHRLLTLVRKQLVRPDRAQLRNDEAYRFRHLLIRDAAYEALPKSVRADLHERFAGWLEERGADLTELDEIVGYHLEQAARYKQELGQPDAGLAERAGDRLAVAGRQALWRGDTQAAAGLLTRALVLLRPIRWDTYLELDLLDSLDLHARDAMAREEEIARRAQIAGDVRGEAVARILIARREYSHGAGRSVDDIEALALATLPLLEEAEDHRGLVRVWDALGFAVSNPRQHYEGWGRAAEQAIAHARAIGQPGLFELPQALVHGPRPADEALQRLESLLQDEPHPGYALWHAVLLAMLGRIDEAQVEANAAFHRWQELTISGIAFWLLALVDLLAGDREAAADHLRTLCDRLAGMGRFAELSTFGPWLGRVLCDLGRYEEAEPLAKQGRDLGAEDDIITQALWRQVQARVLAHRGEHVGAERLAREAVALMESSDSLNWQGDALCDLAEVLQRAGRAQEAAALLEEALERYGAKRNLPMVAQVRRRMAAMRTVR